MQLGRHPHQLRGHRLILLGSFLEDGFPIRNEREDRYLLPGGTVVFYTNTEGELAIFLPQVIADYLLLGAYRSRVCVGGGSCSGCGGCGCNAAGGDGRWR